MKIKVAIYSGSAPGPIFIENLIKTLSSQKIQIYIFGDQEESYINLFKNVKLITRRKNRLSKIFFFIKQFLTLTLIKPKIFYKVLKYYLKNSNDINSNFYFWLNKVMPVANNLPDIFHIQWAKSLSFWIFLNEIFNIKIILSLRGAHVNYSPLNDKMLALEYKRLFPKVDFFHAVSDAILKEALKYSDINVNAKVIYTAFNKVNFMQKKNQEIKTSYNFISVGRHHWKKGYQYSVSAINTLLKLGLNVNYTIVAKGKPSEEILYQIRYLRIYDNVKLISMHKQEDIYREIFYSDCLILPSVEEGIANVIIESMGLGTPVISSDCGGMKEVIKNGQNGLIFKSRDVDDLVDCMNLMTKLNDKDRKLMVENAKKTINNKFSMKRLGSEMYELYLKVLNDNSN